MNIYLITDSLDYAQAHCPMLRSSPKTILVLGHEQDMTSQKPANTPWTLVSLRLACTQALSLIRQVRKASGKLIVVVDAAEQTQSQRMQCYDAGADIVLSETPAYEEMLALVNAQVRAFQHIGKPRKQAPEVSIEFQYASQQVHGPKGPVKLSSRECILLQAFVRAQEQKLSLKQIGELLGDEDYEGGGHVRLSMAAYRLRGKLIKAGAESRCLRAIYRQGFELSCALTVH